MSPKKKTNLHDLIKADDNFGIMVGKDIIPSPLGRGRIAKVPQLTIAKALDTALKQIAEEGIGISEEKAGFNLEAPGTAKEAKKLGLKNVAMSFFTYAMKQVEHYNLKEKVEIVRRESGKKVYIRGPHADEA